MKTYDEWWNDQYEKGLIDEVYGRADPRNAFDFATEQCQEKIKQLEERIKRLEFNMDYGRPPGQ